MKCARPIKDEASAARQGPAIVAFPQRHGSATSEVLARLLAGERLTSLDAVTDASTTRLAAVVWRLQNAHGWRISREDRALGCVDGRVTTVCVYFLSPECIEAAALAGSADWCAKVREARKAQRARAADAKQTAARLNAARNGRQPRQADFWRSEL